MSNVSTPFVYSVDIVFDYNGSVLDLLFCISHLQCSWGVLQNTNTVINYKKIIIIKMWGILTKKYSIHSTKDTAVKETNILGANRIFYDIFAKKIIWNSSMFLSSRKQIDFKGTVHSKFKILSNHFMTFQMRY